MTVELDPPRPMNGYKFSMITYSTDTITVDVYGSDPTTPIESHMASKALYKMHFGVFHSNYSRYKGRFRIYDLGPEVFRGPRVIFTSHRGPLILLLAYQGSLVFFMGAGISFATSFLKKVSKTHFFFILH